VHESGRFWHSPHVASSSPGLVIIGRLHWLHSSRLTRPSPVALAARSHRGAGRRSATERIKCVAPYGSERDASVQALRDLATFYATHPDVRAPESVAIRYYTQADTDEENSAIVDAIAATLDVVAHWANGYYVARRDFGSVFYEAIAVPEAAALAAYPAIEARADAA
jgi:hypothetical protein